MSAISRYQQGTCPVCDESINQKKCCFWKREVTEFPSGNFSIHTDCIAEVAEKCIQCEQDIGDASFESFESGTSVVKQHHKCIKSNNRCDLSNKCQDPRTARPENPQHFSTISQDNFDVTFHKKCAQAYANTNICINCDKQIKPGHYLSVFNQHSNLKMHYDCDRPGPVNSPKTIEAEKQIPVWQIPLYVISSVVAVIFGIVFLGIPAVIRYGNSDQSKEEIAAAEAVQKELEPIFGDKHEYHKMDWFDHYSHTVASALVHLLPPDRTTVKNLGEVIKHQGKSYLKISKSY